MANHMNSDAKGDAKRKQAQERAEVRAARTPQQQLDILDYRLGKGVGAKKERAKLLKMLEKE